MLLDFYFTNSFSQGDYSAEANPIGRLWWQLTGSFRFIEIPIWALAVIGSAYFINYFNKILPLFWLNMLALNHLLGAASWSGLLDFTYHWFRYDWQMGYLFSFAGALLSVPLTLVEVRLAKDRK